jgi:hypothetical protein
LRCREQAAAHLRDHAAPDALARSLELEVAGTVSAMQAALKSRGISVWAWARRTGVARFLSARSAPRTSHHPYTRKRRP